jgi:putative transcriptional regulator
VATPALEEPNFARTIVLLLEHGDEGAFGLVLNRPSDVPLGEAVPAWISTASAPAVMFVGGPVGPDQAIGLARVAVVEAVEGCAPLFGDLATVDLARQPGGIPVEELRVFVGYAGWGAGQLEGEIATGSWFVVDADAGADPFFPRPDDLWRVVLARQPDRLAWFANFPGDVTSN